VLVTGISIFDPVSSYLIHSSAFTSSHMPFSLLLGVLALGFLYNPVARAFWPAGVMDRRDLAAVLAIGFLGSNVPTLAQRFVSVISAPDYFASPENEWHTYTLPNLQDWLFPSNVGDSVGRFYQGMPPGEQLPWEVWFEPLFWWFALLIALLGACFCLGVTLRRQWSERERLTFPLAELPLMLVQDPEPGRHFPSFVREIRFWIGFSIPAFMILWNTVGHFNPGLPTFSFLNSNNPLAVGRGFLDFFMRFDFYIICFAYFTTLEILLSMWFFHLLAMVQSGLSHRIGFGPEGYGAGVISQNNYGLLVFVVWGIYMARDHIRDVVRKALGKAPEVDDSDEIVSYRVAFFGAVMSFVFIYFWLRKTNMSPFVSVTFIVSTFVLYLGMAKIVALSGLVSLRGSGPTGPVKALIGIWNMDDTTIAALNNMGALYGNAKGYVMPGAANSLKAAESTQPDRRRVGGAVFLGGVLCIVGFTIATLLLGYFGPGAENFGSYSYTIGNRYFFNATVSNIKDVAEAKREYWDLGFGLFGAIGTSILILLNQRVPWWPLHPVGFTVSLQYPTRASFFSVFLAWLMKSIILRIGGNEMYNRTKVVIYGAILGYSTAVTISFVLDIFFFMGQGHAVHTPPL
jgi:hypothetical protein